MKIQTITINNFRSIKSETIQFDNNCLILLGKNEAGKSNVLKAIAALFGQYNVTNKDKRKRIENEKITDYFVRAKFEYNETDIKNLYDNILKKYPTIKNLTFQNDKGLFDYIKEELPLIYYQIDIKDNSQANFIHDKGKNFNVIPSKDIYITGNVISTQSEGSKIELFSLLIDEIKVEYDKDPYKCILWHYNNNLLLPKSVNREQFIASPSNYRALENIFILCNRSNIAQEFKDAKEQDGDYENLLDQVSTAVTKTFREIWRDLRDTSIKLSSDGAEIRIKVVNKAKYAFEDRSDGFKKFISILLMLSTRARANKIGERNVILIDEPDQSLYPTSATHLRDELLKISKNCYVIYSTHCQYMIDSNCLERHLIVEKKNDITTIRKEERNAEFSDDELLRRAIGSSIFECLKEKNIIFEGWTDKELFIKYCSFKENKDFENVGITFLHGISGVGTLASLMIAANKKFIIVSDSDQTSKNKRKDFEKSFPDHKGCWLEYDVVNKDIKTLEDFIKPTIIENVIKEMEHNGFRYDLNKNAITNIEQCIKEQEKRQECKKKIIVAIKKEDIKETYSEFSNKLKSKLESL